MSDLTTTVREEIDIVEDGCILEIRQQPKKGTLRVWINDHEMKEGFGRWFLISQTAILFDSAIGRGSKIVVEYSAEKP